MKPTSMIALKTGSNLRWFLGLGVEEIYHEFEPRLAGVVST